MRCSSLDLIAACPASARPGAIQTDADTPEARLGSAVHEVLAARVKDWPWSVQEAAERWRVDPDEVARLAAWAWSGWITETARYFPDPQTEVPLSHTADGLTLTGTVDVLSVVGNECRINDHKGGWRHARHDAQLTGYAFLVLQAHPDLGRAYVSIFRIREQAREAWYIERAEADAWWCWLVEHVKRENVFNPGGHCSHCPRRLDCPAYERSLARSAAIMLAIDHQDLPAPGPERAALIGELHQRRKQLEQGCELIRELERAEVAAAGGVLNIGNGQQLELVRQERRTIDFVKGYPILAAAADPDLLNEAVKIGKSAAEKAVMARASRGQKSAAVREVLEDLEAAGAVSVTISERLELKRCNNVHNSTTRPAIAAAREE